MILQKKVTQSGFLPLVGMSPGANRD